MAAHTEHLRILGLVDLHWSGKGEPRLPDVDGYDLVLLGGDLTNFLGGEAARRIVEPIRSAGPAVLAVCGNCDLPEMESYFDAADVALDRRARVVGGVRFLGLSGGLPFGNLPYERTEQQYSDACAELERVAAAIPWSGPTVLVSHQPPYGTRCDLTAGRHVGSHAVRACIERLGPELVFSGHIHESIGQDRLGTSHVVNPGPWFRGHWLEVEESGAGRLGVALRHDPAARRQA